MNFTEIRCTFLLNNISGLKYSKKTFTCLLSICKDVMVYSHSRNPPGRAENGTEDHDQWVLEMVILVRDRDRDQNSLFPIVKYLFALPFQSWIDAVLRA